MVVFVVKLGSFCCALAVFANIASAQSEDIKTFDDSAELMMDQYDEALDTIETK